jgi:hypothetical protein
MSSRDVPRAALRTICVAMSLAHCGCAQPLGGMLLPNQRPVVELTQFPASETNRFFYAYRLEWSGHDPDGFVDHYLYAVDPPAGPAVDTTWIATQDRAQTVVLRSDVPDPSGGSGNAVGFHTFALKAIDNQGDASPVVSRAFFTSTVAPFVQIVTPRPSGLAVVSLAPSVRIAWEGDDPDGISTRRPVRYKYLLLSPGSQFPISVALDDPDSLRRFYAPGFAGWDSSTAEVTEAHYSNLTPGANYVFAVVGFDEAGAYSPVFSLDTNMLRFRVGFATSLGPTITLYNDFFHFTYPSGGYSLDPGSEVVLEVLPGDPVRIHWSAAPRPGTSVQTYRWRLNGDVFDETPRSDEGDISHWSSPSLLTQSVTLGPFAGGEEHRFYVEASDNVGLKSLGIVKIIVPGGIDALSRELLIVDDTRFNADQLGVGGCVRPPLGVWPTAAELDTFLYARGGVPWKCYPTGTISGPGIFAGFPFDTISTGGSATSFFVLGLYRHIVWITDARSALQTGSGAWEQTITSLRYMSQIGRMNMLSAHLRRGGKVWLAGGGAGFASTIDYAGTTGPSFSASAGELAPGRFMYDHPHWRSEFTSISARLLGVQKSARAVGGWPGAPDYGRLPPTLDARTPSTDPFPPNRAGQSGSVFYKSIYDFEYLSRSNEIVEGVAPDTSAALDSLYRVVSLDIPGTNNVVMTYYHGTEGGPVIFSGFDLWNYRRTQCAGLVRFVLGDIWGIPQTGP